MDIYKKHILVVEDDVTIGKKLINTLQIVNIDSHLHLSTTIANSLKFIETNRVDIIVLDLNLPDGNGIQILKWVRENIVNTEIDIFVFSINISLRKFSLKTGATAFFDKATDFDLLIETIQKSVNQTCVS